VETAIRQYANPSQPAGSRVHQANLLRVVNRTKQKLRPDEPDDLNFEVFQLFRKAEIIWNRIDSYVYLNSPNV
jgi:hypothetical protein